MLSQFPTSQFPHLHLSNIKTHTNLLNQTLKHKTKPINISCNTTYYMASTSALSMAVPLTCYASQTKISPTSDALFLKPLMAPSSKVRFVVKASLKEQAVAGMSAAALSASMVIPQAAVAAESGGLPPSLKNLLLSVVAGGVVITAIVGAVIAVSNFDPVKRGN